MLKSSQSIYIILISIAVGLYRIVVEPTSIQVPDTYKDIAHIVVGGLFGAWLLGYSFFEQLNDEVWSVAKLCGWSALLLTILEVVCVAIGINK